MCVNVVNVKWANAILFMDNWQFSPVSHVIQLAPVLILLYNSDGYDIINDGRPGRRDEQHF